MSEVRASCTLVALSLAMAPPAVAQPAGRVIGLLSLRQVQGPLCGPPPRAEVALFAAPNSADPIGWIRAAAHPLSEPDCYRPNVTVRLRADGREHVLPTEEYEEEAPLGAIVVERRQRWFKVQLGPSARRGAAWLHASSSDQYFSLQELLVRRPAYLTGAWDGFLAKAPGAAGRPAADPRRQYVPIQLVGSRDVRGALWLNIEVMSHTIYESDEPPRVVATGWVPAHDRAGKAVVWFNSRD